MDELLESKIIEESVLEGVTDSLSNLQNEDSAIDDGEREGGEEEGEEEGSEEEESRELREEEKGEGEEEGGRRRRGDEEDEDEEWEKVEDEEGEEAEEEEKVEDWLDLLGNGQLMKKVIKPGSSGRPSRGDKVTICYRGVFNAIEFENKEDYSFVLGDDEAIKALDLAVSLMEVGEVAMVKSVDRFTYEGAGFPPIVPPGAEVEFEVELLSREDAPAPGDLPAEERIVKGTAKRERGNKFFKEGDFGTAEIYYKKSLEYAETDFENVDDPDTVDKMTALMDLRLKSLNNLVVTYQKLGRDSDALNHCNLVLAIDQKNTRALLRKGEVLLALKEFDDSIAAFTAGARIAPGDVSFRTGLQRAKDAKTSYSKKERSVYSTMLKAMEREEAPASPKSEAAQEPEQEDEEGPPTPENSSLDDSKAEIDVVGVTPAKQPPQDAPEREHEEEDEAAEPAPFDITEAQVLIESQIESQVESQVENPTSQQVTQEETAPIQTPEQPAKVQKQEEAPQVLQAEVKPEVKPEVQKQEEKAPNPVVPEVTEVPTVKPAEPEPAKKKTVLPPPKPVEKKVAPSKPWWASATGVIVISIIVAVIGLIGARTLL